jgi:hypothetical protein
MWAWAMGSCSLAAVVNQIAIAVCWRVQDATDSDHHEQRCHRETVSTNS